MGAHLAISVHSIYPSCRKWNGRCVVSNTSRSPYRLYRNAAEPYFKKLPDQIEERKIILVDPMLATGSSATQAADFLKRDGAKNILFVCLVAAPEGIAYFHKQHAEIVHGD